jgi:hypothetical protein
MNNDNQGRSDEKMKRNECISSLGSMGFHIITLVLLTI